MSSKTLPRIIHCRASGLAIPGIPAAPGGTTTGRVLLRGETVEVSPELYAETLDRNGVSWLDLSPEDQVRRWGMQRFGEGPAPEGMVLGEDDSAYRIRKWQREVTYAEKISDPRERWAELQRIARDYPEFKR